MQARLVLVLLVSGALHHDAAALKPGSAAGGQRRAIKGGNTPAVEVTARRGVSVKKIQNADRHPDYTLELGRQDGRPMDTYGFQRRVRNLGGRQVVLGKHNIFEVRGKAGDDVEVSLHLPVSGHVDPFYARPNTQAEFESQQAIRRTMRPALARVYAKRTTFRVDITRADGSVESRRGIKARGLSTTHALKLKMTPGTVHIAAYPEQSSGSVGSDPEGRNVELRLSPR